MGSWGVMRFLSRRQKTFFSLSRSKNTPGYLFLKTTSPHTGFSRCSQVVNSKLIKHLHEEQCLPKPNNCRQFLRPLRGMADHPLCELILIQQPILRPVELLPDTIYEQYLPKIEQKNMLLDGKYENDVTYFFR